MFMSLQSQGRGLLILVAGLLLGGRAMAEPAARGLIMAQGASEVAAANPANANRRFALIIANSAYGGGASWPTLVNPANDARLLAAAFTADGFEVTPLIDGAYDTITQGVALWERKVAGAATVVIYYAGHGFEYAGRNYIVPIGAPTTVSSDDLPRRFVELDLDKLVYWTGQPNTLNLVFLDACRTPGPLVTIPDAKDSAALHASVDLNLPKAAASSGAQVAVFYSTALGQPALDGAPSRRDNSPFAWNVAQMLKAPRLELATFFKAVTYEVERQTHGMTPLQQPYSYASVRDEFFLRDALAPADTGESGPAAMHLDISDHDLETVDETILATRVLRRYSPARIQAMAESDPPDSIATYLLGFFYEFGVGVPPDLVKARAWLERAAATQHPAGELELGYFLSNAPANPTPSPADKARALALYEKAASQGYAKAKTFLAYALLNGTLGARDMPRAVKLYHEASDAGHPDAMYQLAMTVLQDRRYAAAPYSIDLPQEIRRLAALAQAGDIGANGSLCRLADFQRSVGADIGDCTVAAQAGDAYAQAYLAIFFHDTAGDPEANYKSRHWTRLALAQAVLLSADLVNTLRKYN